LGVIQDITDNKKAEKIIKKQYEELERKNKEMESFIYTVSHDLKSPIITIKGFLNFLKTDYQNKDEHQFLEDYQNISNAADKMQELLEDLLQLSRIGRVVNPPQKIKMTIILESAIANLNGVINAKRANIEYPKDMPEINADKDRIREIWQNLIENSIKYSRPNTAPKIVISYEIQDNIPVFSLTDNGIGIEERFFVRVFDLFEKLNPNSAGSGVGLARIKKIVELYNGKIWIESSELDKGSTFKFYLNPINLISQ
jgi:light-regulated signal transduction histidine kinase (bacteriophytochrome)